MHPIPVLGFSAYSGVGKTTLIEKLTAYYTKKGLRVAVIKHDAHDFTIDQEGKDSWRFTHAGAVMTLLASRTKTAVIESRPASFSQLLSRVHDADLVLAEGYKEENIPRIGLFRSGSGKPLPPSSVPCIAIVTDVPLPEYEVPQFAPDAVPELAEWILEKMMPDGAPA